MKLAFFDSQRTFEKRGNARNGVTEFDTSWNSITDLLAEVVPWQRAEGMVFLSEWEFIHLYTCILILNAGVLRFKRSALDYYTVLGKISNILSVLPDFETCWKSITDHLNDAISWERAEVVIFLSELDSFQVYVMESKSSNIVLKQDSLIPHKGSGSGWVCDNRDIHVRKDIQTCQEFFEDYSYHKEGIGRLINIPLLVRDTCLGSLNIGSLESGDPTAEELNFLRHLATQLAMALDNVLAHEQLTRLRRQLTLDSQHLRKISKNTQTSGVMVGRSKALRQVQCLAESVAPTDATVLLTGETGTGKELLARYIHDLSPRKIGKFVRINCAGLPAGLVESELFGHERGSFTGAEQQKPGKFELAHKGTLFLDEIGEMPPEAQAKLLRVLQDGHVDRVGGTESIPVDVRIIAATNSDLTESIGASKFRADLYYRLHVFPISLPPLRDRQGDIPVLARHFMEQYRAKFQRSCEEIDQDSIERLNQYPWPGNIRELQNVIERATILSNTSVLHIDDLLLCSHQESYPKILGHNLKDLERKKTLEVLEQADWQIDGIHGAAKLLGLHPSTLRSRLKKLGIRRPPIQK